MRKLLNIIPYILTDLIWILIGLLLTFLSPLILAGLIYYKLTGKNPKMKWNKTPHYGRIPTWQKRE